ncbi:short-chain dehydrogenase [Cystobasidium minutum MCA 4210]|uniref:short-chain dehydrogenase n=1 Tax=Cystobasidium minutum MCA 4210 TaxID=1397322 RepID=UPI0034CE0132|eukprot:jgi/Rhomi1/157757/estExt_Genewise1Plus.C_2_t10368
MSKTIIVTGASRGLGLACARILLDKFNCNVVTISRSMTEELQGLKKEFNGRIEVVQGDVTSLEDQKAALDKAVTTFGGLDGLVLNAGVAAPQLRIENMVIERMRKLFDINFFSLVSMLQISIPHLRKTKGTVIFTSSGAATGNTTSWAAYNGSKAALNALCRTLAAEEPEITAVALRPGVVDTPMQTELIAEAKGQMSDKDYQRFVDIHEQKKLVPPEYSGHVLAALAVKADKGLSGQFVNYSDESMSAYQPS